MNAIWKYPVYVDDLFELEMPVGAAILTIQLQDRHPCLWALVDTSAPVERRKLAVRGTGLAIEANLRYIGTFQQPPFVWHLHEVMS